MDTLPKPEFEAGIRKGKVQPPGLSKAIGTAAVLAEHGVTHATRLIVYKPQVFIQNQKIIFHADL